LFRALGLLSLLIALLVVGLMFKHQLNAQHVQRSVPAASSADGLASAPEISTPAQARQVQQQVQDDLNRLTQERGKQIDQGVESDAK
jgi:sensor histidine kinase regulating citrate/malate metabolism